jgi:hypothetical protein
MAGGKGGGEVVGMGKRGGEGVVRGLMKKLGKWSSEFRQFCDEQRFLEVLPRHRAEPRALEGENSQFLLTSSVWHFSSQFWVL